MDNKLMVNVALTGCIAQKADNPALPITPDEVAADAQRCADLGATVFHVHARNKHGNAVSGAAEYRAYVDALRKAVPGAVVCVSCSGRHGQTVNERADGLLARPDLGSLTLGSVDFETGTAVNDRRTVRAMAWRMKDLGVMPEYELFDLGHVYRLSELTVRADLVSLRGWINFIWGVHVPFHEHGWRGIARLLRDFCFAETWAFGGIGAAQWPANKAAIERDALGHVRTGLEDNLLMEQGVPATNMSLVERVVRYGRVVGREPATIAEAREALGL